MARLPDALDVWSVDGRMAAELNGTAALIFLLCDGRHSEADIAEVLRECFPQDEAELRADVACVVADLKLRGFLQDQSRGRPRSVLKVAFLDFWPDFEERRNYFLNMLTYSFDPMVVAADDNDVDLLFFSTCDPPDPRCDTIDLERTRTVFVRLNDQIPRLDDYDYAFVAGELGDSEAGQQFHLPIWAMFTDWTGYDRAVPYVFRDNRLPASFHPKTACQHLVDALKLDDDARAPAPTPTLPSFRRTSRPRYRVPMPEPGKKLTIGMASYDDYDGVYFTVQALRIFHPECFPDAEIVIIDNDPDGRCGDALRKFVESIDVCRYVPFSDFASTCVKDLVVREARSDAVLCVDSHVLIYPGAIKRLIEFFDERPDCTDLLHGPVLDDGLRRAVIQWNPSWRKGGWAAYDDQGSDPDSEPFEIDVQMNGLFACRKDAWLGFSPRFVGFGEEEGYIHEKFRRAGRRVLCLPFLRWAHRFAPREKRTAYPNLWADRVRNIILGHRELGLDSEPVKEYFSGYLGSRNFERIIADIEDEMKSPFFTFEVPYYVDLSGCGAEWVAVQRLLKALGVHRPRRFSNVDPSKDAQTNRVLAHRAIVEFAQYAQFESVIVFDEVVTLPESTRKTVAESVLRLPDTGWKVFAIVSARHAQSPGCKDKERLCGYGGVAAGPTYAMAYHRRAFQDVLDILFSVADDEVGAENGTVESYLRGVDGEFFVCRVPSGLEPRKRD